MYRIPNGASMAVGVGLLSLASLIVLQPSHAQTASTSSDQSTSTTTTTPAPGTGMTTVPGTGISNSPTYGNPTPGGINTTPGYSTNVTPGFAGNNSLPNYGLTSSNGMTTNTLNATPSAPIMYNSNYAGMPDFTSWGGPGYDGAPDTDVNSSFIGAGGGPYNFSIKMALAQMGGHVWAEDEILSLQAKFGPLAVQQWQDTFQFAVLDGYLQAKKAGINISWEQTYGGPLLGEKVIESGQNGDHNFRSGYFFDKTISSDVHHQVMRDIWIMNGGLSLRDFHRITNQAITDLAHQLGYWDVHAGDVQDMTYDNTSPQPLAPALGASTTAPLPSNNGSTPNPAQ